MFFANCQKGGMSAAFPDVCKTPVGPSVVPIPYPNVARTAAAKASTTAKKVLFCGSPAHNLKTVVPSSNGDEPGVLKGVISSKWKGPRKYKEGVKKVLIQGSPATRLMGVTMQNGKRPNMLGCTVMPSQTTVEIVG